jgi:hypothetical protein
MKSKQGVLEDGLKLVVHDQNQRSTHTSQNVRSGSFEEGLGSFLRSDFLETVEGSVVENLLLAVFSDSSGLHHKSSSDGVQRVRGHSGNGGNVLKN